MGPELAIGALIVGTAASAGGQIMQGREQAKAAAFEQDQLRIQAEATRTAAAQDETNRRNELTSSLETIEAIRAGRGLSDSPGGMAILEGVTNRAERDIGISQGNYAMRAGLLDRQAAMSASKGSMSLLSGYLGAAGTVGSAAFNGYSTYNKYQPGPTARF
jgi:hypothetical protein